MVDATPNRRIRRGVEQAERSMQWHGEHIPYTVYVKLPSSTDDDGEREKE